MTMGLTYFTQTYINIRLIREYAKSTLPIEVVYSYEAVQPPASIVKYMLKQFASVTFIDARKLGVMPKAFSFAGYHIKVFVCLDHAQIHRGVFSLKLCSIAFSE